MRGRDPSRWQQNPDGTYRRKSSMDVVEAEPASMDVAEAEEEGEDATAAASKLADELGIDLASISGTGLNGRITVGDVQAAADAS